MEHIKVEKTKLLNTIKTNRNNHRKIFLEAQEGYKKECINHLENNLKRAKDGKTFQVNMYITQPVDQTKDYDRIIKMLEMSKDKTIHLSERDFQQYVMDDWNWKQTFLSSNAKYSGTAAVECANLGIEITN